MLETENPSCENNLINANNFAGFDKKLLDACIHCGLCLPACPTYQATAREMESPRGRIYLLNQIAENKLPINQRAKSHLDSCLGCLSCQTACPSGVQYESILMSARETFAKIESPAKRSFMRFIFKDILPDYGKLKLLGKALRLWQKSGAKDVLKPFLVIPGLGTIIEKCMEWQSLMPSIPEYKPLPTSSWQAGEKTGQVNVFSGCVMDIFYNDVNHATISLLTKTKKIVKVGEQTCCGALAYHAGETDIARDLAKKNIDFFENQSGEIVVNAAGCGAMLKHYPELLKDDPEFHERAEDFAGRVKDFTEYLDKENWSPDYIENKDSTANKTKLKVAYHAACHLCHAQAIRKEPEQLLDKCTNIETKPLEDKELCCGSAGIFNITHPELSFQVLADKMKRIAETDANVIVTTNPGCMIQLEYGAKASGLNIKVRHLASLLDEQDSST